MRPGSRSAMISEAFIWSLLLRLGAFHRLAGGHVLLLSCGKRGSVEVITSTSSSRSRCAAGLTITSMKPSRSGSRNHFVDHADRQAAGKNLVAARGEHLLAGLDALVGQDADDLRLAGRIAAQNAANARGLKNHARAAGLVVDGQHLRVCGNTSRTLPTMPSGVMTAMSRSRPSFEPLSM